MGASVSLSKGFLKKASKTITFTGAANLGAVGAVPLFTVTGEVLVQYITAVCTVNLASAGGGTLALGVTGGVALFTAATTGTDLVAGDLWIDATPAEVNGVAVPAGHKDILITDNIIGTVAGGGAITAGAIRIDVYYLPISSDGLVVAA